MPRGSCCGQQQILPNPSIPIVLIPIKGRASNRTKNTLLQSLQRRLAGYPGTLDDGLGVDLLVDQLLRLSRQLGSKNSDRGAQRRRCHGHWSASSKSQGSSPSSEQWVTDGFSGLTDKLNMWEALQRKRAPSPGHGGWRVQSPAVRYSREQGGLRGEAGDEDGVSTTLLRELMDNDGIDEKSLMGRGSGWLITGECRRCCRLWATDSGTEGARPAGSNLVAPRVGGRSPVMLWWVGLSGPEHGCQRREFDVVIFSMLASHRGWDIASRTV
ncbi:hypothetical protein FDECE_8146 [Fusarium decemcellulare]|nr:hypothetical protein FDECE_8146 [Fusarium decemcellulare]